MSSLQQLHDSYIEQVVAISLRVLTSRDNSLVSIKPTKLLRMYPRGKVYKRLHGLNGRIYNRVGDF